MTPQTSRWNRGVGLSWVAALGAAWVLGGCVQQQPKLLPSDAFVGPRAVQDRSRVQPVDQGGTLLYEGSPPPAAGAGERKREAAADAETGVSPTVAQSVRPVREEGFQDPGPLANAAKAADDDGAPSAPPATSAPATQPEAKPESRPGDPAGDRAAEAAPAERAVSVALSVAALDCSACSAGLMPLR